MLLSATDQDFRVRCSAAVQGDEIEITVVGTRRFEIERDDSRAKALARLKALRRPLPKGFRFDRREANERSLSAGSPVFVRS
jgi:carbamoylphosphate synthase large subunit